MAKEKIQQSLFPVNEWNYHINSFAEKEISFAQNITKSILKEYPTLEKHISKCFSNVEYSDKEKQLLLQNVTMAFCHFVNANNLAQNEAQLHKLVKKYYFLYFDIILDNYGKYHGSHCVQFEPICCVTIYIANRLCNNLAIYFASNSNVFNSDFDQMFVTEKIMLGRTIKSALLLLTIGDDAHGLSLMRGVLENMSTLCLAEKFRDDFVKFKKYNAVLQYHKAVKLNPKILDKESEKQYSKMLVDLNKDSGKLSDNAMEKLLLYGWAKNGNGKRIGTLKEFVKVAFGNDDKQFDYILHLSSEFVHEDYNSVFYDFIGIRQFVVNLLYMFISPLVADFDCKLRHTLQLDCVVPLIKELDELNK